MKPNLSLKDQVRLLIRRGLIVHNEAECETFLATTNYYRFSGYARYFQEAPHLNNNSFRSGVSFSEIREVYEADEALRVSLTAPLAQAELVLRTHVARIIANDYGP